MYRSAITDVLTQNVTDLASLVSWPADELEREWRRLDLRIEAPPPERVDLHEPGYLDRVVAEAERLAADEADT